MASSLWFTGDTQTQDHQLGKVIRFACRFSTNTSIIVFAGYDGLSIIRNRKHYSVRSECLNRLAILFNGLPLHYTHVGVSHIGSDEAHVCALQ